MGGWGVGRKRGANREGCFMRCLALFIYIVHLSVITHRVDFMCYLQRFKITVCSVNFNSLELTVGGD